MSENPILSLCVTGRNDNYGFRFKQRFVQAMNFLAWSAERANVAGKLEVVFCDWNSDSALAENLLLSEAASRMVRFISVPPETARKFNPSFSPFSQSIAFNVALRRSHGKYMGIMPADILLSSHALRNLFGILCETHSVSFDPENAVIAVPRKNIPFYADEASHFSSPDRIESYLLSADAWMLCDNTARGMMGGYGVFILDRKLLFSLRGVDERIAGWGYNDTDLALRCADRASVVNLSGYGVYAYDFEPSFRMLMQKESRRTGFHPIHLGFAENSKDWGLADLTFQELFAKTGTMSFPESEMKTDPILWRSWIIWLSQQISPSQVPFFSAAALLAARIAYEKKAERIFLYGTKDRSILSLLALSVPFANLFIHEMYETGEEHERIWCNDNVFGPRHHIGRVHYYPALDIIHSEPGDLIIIDDRIPASNSLIRNLSVSSSIVISRQSANKFFFNPPENLFLCKTEIFGNILYQKEFVRAHELRRFCKKMNGNWISRLLQPFLSKHYSKIRKLWAILFRQPLLAWPRVLFQIAADRKK